jgi:hypothetical protein
VASDYTSDVEVSVEAEGGDGVDEQSYETFEGSGSGVETDAPDLEEY